MQLFKIQKDLENHYRDMQVRKGRRAGYQHTLSSPRL